MKYSSVKKSLKNKHSEIYVEANFLKSNRNFLKIKSNPDQTTAALLTKSIKTPTNETNLCRFRHNMESTQDIKLIWKDT